MNIIKCIVVDDEPKAIDVLARYICKLSFLDLLGSFRDSSEALEFVTLNKVDLVFLDINMPGLSGIQLAKLLNRQTEIIFATAYPDYALEGFDLEVGDYLLKPITFERFLKAVTRIATKLDGKPSGSASSNDEWVVLKSGTHLYRMSVNDILFLEKDGNYITVHTKKKKILIRLNMNEAFTVFPARHFVQVHKSFIVALNAIDLVDSDIIHIQHTQIPLSRTYQDEFLHQFYQSSATRNRTTDRPD